MPSCTLNLGQVHCKIVVLPPDESRTAAHNVFSHLVMLRARCPPLDSVMLLSFTLKFRQMCRKTKWECQKHESLFMENAKLWSCKTSCNKRKISELLG